MSPAIELVASPGTAGTMFCMQHSTRQRKISAAKVNVRVKVARAAERARAALTHIDITVRSGSFSVKWGTGETHAEDADWFTDPCVGTSTQLADVGGVDISTLLVDQTMFELLGSDAYTELSDSSRSVVGEFDASIAVVLQSLIMQDVEVTDVCSDDDGVTLTFADGTQLRSSLIEEPVVALLDSLPLQFILGHVERTPEGWELVFADLSSTTALNVGVEELSVLRVSFDLNEE
jgi:hypothetical protein